MRTWGVALLLMTSALTGCLSRGDEGVDSAAVENASALNVTAPDGRGNLVAFEETNLTESGAGGVDHHHDNWNGQGRVVVFEAPSMMEPFPDGNGASSTFQPPQGRFIYEGTASVEVTISNPQRHACEPLVTFGAHFYCTDYLGGAPAAPLVPDPNPPAGLKLRYKHASTVEWIDVGELTWSTPLPIQIKDPRETDMPHATSSVWQFQVVSPNAQDVTLVFDAKAEIVRAVGVVPLWPPHPLFYTPENPTRIIVDNVEAKACDNGFTNTGCTVTGGDAEPVVPAKLVSYGTKALHIWANITDFQAPNPATAPVTWFLYHNNATGRSNITNPFDYANNSIDARELHWILPVDDGSMDSPYADGSRWSFALGASYTTPDNPVRKQSCYGGCAEWAATYTLTIVASSIEPTREEMHLYCLDPESYCGQ